MSTAVPLTTHDSPATRSPTPPLSPSSAPTLNLEPGTLNSARPWQPSGDDHLIFEWVKMQGKTQREVAGMFGIDQSTVSRVIQRYERWQAHAKARENGRLDHAERLKAQRWLTYERNELILTSCLRIAQEMEGFTDVSKSTICRPASKPSQETEVRTQHATIDRSGVAARFLRLAYRINMDQLKLAALFAREGEAPAEPVLVPLTDEELAEQDRQAAADAAELAAARRRADEAVGWDKAAPAADGPPPPSTDDIALPGSSLVTHFREGPPSPSAEPSAPPASALNLEPGTWNAVPLHALHNLHTENSSQIAATSTAPCSCVLEVRVERNSINSCIPDCDQSPLAKTPLPKTPLPKNGDSTRNPAATAERSPLAPVPVATT